MKLTGNTILVTGGTSGLGLGLALRFQRAGNTVVIAGRRRDLLAQVAEEHPGVGTVELDVLETAMPVEDFLTATMDLLRTEPDAHEILVDQVKVLRNAVVDGTYDKVFAMLPVR